MYPNRGPPNRELQANLALAREMQASHKSGGNKSRPARGGRGGGGAGSNSGRFVTTAARLQGSAPAYSNTGMVGGRGGALQSAPARAPVGTNLGARNSTVTSRSGASQAASNSAQQAPPPAQQVRNVYQNEFGGINAAVRNTANASGGGGGGGDRGAMSSPCAVDSLNSAVGTEPVRDVVHDGFDGSGPVGNKIPNAAGGALHNPYSVGQLKTADQEQSNTGLAAPTIAALRFASDENAAPPVPRQSSVNSSAWPKASRVSNQHQASSYGDGDGDTHMKGSSFNGSSLAPLRTPVTITHPKDVMYHGEKRWDRPVYKERPVNYSKYLAWVDQQTASWDNAQLNGNRKGKKPPVNYSDYLDWVDGQAASSASHDAQPSDLDLGSLQITPSTSLPDFSAGALSVAGDVQTRIPGLNLGTPSAYNENQPPHQIFGYIQTAPHTTNIPDVNDASELESYNPHHQGFGYIKIAPLDNLPRHNVGYLPATSTASDSKPPAAIARAPVSANGIARPVRGTLGTLADSRYAPQNYTS